MTPINPLPPSARPQRPFPPYTHIPGATPHPVGDASGHSFGRHESACAQIDPANWRACEQFVWGIDLFNAGYYWEAHEAWEAVWIAAGRRGPTADFLKGLIKLAAAGVKLREQNPAGARRHLRRAEELFSGVESQRGTESTRMFGLVIEELRTATDRLRHSTFSADWPRDGRPVRVFDLMLRPT